MTPTADDHDSTEYPRPHCGEHPYSGPIWRAKPPMSSYAGARAHEANPNSDRSTPTQNWQNSQRQPHPSRWLMLASVLMLCACESPVEKAKREYDMAKRAGAHAAELCTRGETVTEAYLKAGDERAYRAQKLDADIECDRLKMDEERGIYNGYDGKPEDMNRPATIPTDSAAPVSAQTPNAISQ